MDNQQPIQINTELITAIAAAVAQALKGSQQTFSMEELGQVIGTSVANGIARTTRRKVTIGEYLQRGHSPFHPKPLAETPTLKYPSFQNGAWMNPATLHDEEINLLNQITHSGVYIDRRVTVVFSDFPGDERIDIRWADGTPDQRLAIMRYFSNFEQCLKMIVAAQVEERLEREAKESYEREAIAAYRARQEEAPKGKVFFGTKATREARERVAREEAGNATP